MFEPAQSAHYVATAISLSSGALERRAMDVKWARAVLETHKPDHILTDGLQNSINLTFLELAKSLNIPITATLHAHWIQNAKLEVFGCDPRLGSIADRCFTWGLERFDVAGNGLVVRWCWRIRARGSWRRRRWIWWLRWCRRRASL